MLERAFVLLVILALLSCSARSRDAENNKSKNLSVPQLPASTAPSDLKKTSQIPSKSGKVQQKKKVFAKAKIKSGPPPAMVEQSRSPIDWQAAPVVVKPCPFSCGAVGSYQGQCNEWQNGTLCYVQDLRRKEVNRNPSSVVVPCQLHINGHNTQQPSPGATRPFDIEALAAIVKEADRALSEAKRAGGSGDAGNKRILHEN